MAKVLITSALPYINGVKHLGNLAGSLLPADIHARFRRQIGDEVLFLCATDEHGTPAELAAAEAGLDIAAYCDRQHAAQAAIYRRFALSFDHFDRSSAPRNHALTQHFFRRLEARGLIAERVLDQIWSPADDRFLPDRYVVGTCPHCGHGRARGDQCESCTRTLDPTELVAPRSALSGATDLDRRPTRHLFLRQSALAGELERWLGSRRGWPPLVSSIARSWLDEGLRDRCITRDLAWGVPVPKPGWQGKVFYVWFDAPIAYIAAAQGWADADPGRRDWRAWWWEARDVEYLQFLGKDNVPFHAIGFPCTLLGSGEPWKTADVIKGVNWLTYEGGKFSTSEGRGVFLDRALDLAPADAWRWWLAANAPEGGDTDFGFARFAAEVNHDLADSFGNLVHRVLSFTAARYGGAVPAGGEAGEPEHRLAVALDRHLADLRVHHRALALRRAAAGVRAIWRLANAYLAEQAPWTAIRSDPGRAAVVLRTGIALVRVAAVTAWAFIPDAAGRVLEALGTTEAVPAWPESGAAALRRIVPGQRASAPPILFAKFPPGWAETQRQVFAGVAEGGPSRIP